MKLFRRFSAIVIIITAISLMHCQDDSGSGAEDIGLENRAIDTLQGSVAINDSTVSYESKALTETKSSITVIIDGYTLEAVIDLQAETLTINGHDAVLTAEQKEVLLLLAQSIHEYLQQNFGDLEAHEFSLVRLLDYWSDSPEGYVYSERSIQGSITGVEHMAMAAAVTCSVNEGITCIRKNTWVTATYDDSKGCHNELIQVGSTAKTGYECMGRCGAGCGWGAPSAWTKDCLDHDQCSFKNNSSGGSKDPNCGDEYNEAADDWTWGVWRGCNGK